MRYFDDGGYAFSSSGERDSSYIEYFGARKNFGKAMFDYFTIRGKPNPDGTCSQDIGAAFEYLRELIAKRTFTDIIKNHYDSIHGIKAVRPSEEAFKSGDLRQALTILENINLDDKEIFIMDERLVKSLIGFLKLEIKEKSETNDNLNQG